MKWTLGPAGLAYFALSLHILPPVPPALDGARLSFLPVLGLPTP